MASETRVHRLILPNNPVDAYAALQEFATSLKDVADDESLEEQEEE